MKQKSIVADIIVASDGTTLGNLQVNGLFN